MSCETVNNNDNLTAVLYGVRDLRLEQRPIPEPESNEVLIKIQCVGICDSDVNYWVHGSIGNYAIEEPVVIGHEASGIVVKLGKCVRNLSIGDRVAIEPGIPCRICQYCKISKFNLCPDMKCCATSPIDGNLTRYYVHDADFCYKLPEHMSLEEGALLESLSIAIHACKIGNVKIGSTVLILGAGPIGLFTLATSKAMGASKIIITDITEYRLNVAKEMGAFKAIKINKCGSIEKIIKNVRLVLNNELPDVTIDCSGVQQTLKMGIEEEIKSVECHFKSRFDDEFRSVFRIFITSLDPLLTKSGGTLTVIVKMGDFNNVELPLFSAFSREVDIKGAFRYCANDYKDALSLIASGQVNLKPLITHNFKIEESLEALKIVETGTENPIKVMIHCNEE